MKENLFKYSVSVAEYDRNKNEKDTSKLKWIEREGTAKTLINDITNNYAFCACFNHNGETFTNKQKSDNNLKSTNFIIFDLDAVKHTARDFYAIMRNTEICPSIVYTTANNGKFKTNKNEEYSNRYRVVYLLDKAITTPKEYTTIHQAIKSEMATMVDDDINTITQKHNYYNDNSDKSPSHFFAGCRGGELYSNDNVISLQWLRERYNINAEVTEKTHDRYIISHTEDNQGGQGGYIISPNRHNNEDSCVSSSSVNVHDDCLNDINNIMNEYNKHGRYIHYLLYDRFRRGQGGLIIYNKKREKHYISTLSSLEDLINSSFIQDYYDLSIQQIYSKYLYTFPSVECSSVEYNDNDLWYYVPDDYIEIKRKWHYEEVEKQNGTTYKVSVIEKAKNGQRRRRRLFINLIIRRLINPSITFEHLLFNGIYELYNHIDNNDENDVITKRDIATLAVNAYFEDLAKWEKLKDYHKPQWKINKEYCIMHHLNARKQAGKVRALINKQQKRERWNEIDKFFNPLLTNKQNVELLKANGVEVSLTALKEYKRENGYTKKKNVTKQKSDIKTTTSQKAENANKAILSNNNKIMEQQHTIMKTSKPGANNKQIEPLNDLVRESENNTTKVMLDGSVKDVTLTELRSELFNGTLLTLTNNIIGVRAFNLNDDLSYTMAVNNSDLTPSFVTTNKSDDVVCFYVCDNDLNENEYNTICNQICDELKSYINVNLNESITTLVEGFEFERSEKFGCISNNIIYNTQFLISRYNAQ